MDNKNNIQKEGPDKFAIILGCAKSGTTSLYEYLVRHPKICACNTREPNSNTHYLKEGTERYKDLWDWDPSTHEYAMEKSTQYTYPTGYDHPSGPEVPDYVSDLAEIDAEFRFLYIVRDPIERAKSHLKHYLKQGYGVPYHRPADIPWLVGTSQYAERLEPWTKEFGRDKFLFLTFHELLDEPEELVSRVYDFLELPPGPPPPARNYNPTEGVWNTSLWNALRGISFLRKGVRILPIEMRSKIRVLVNSPVEKEISFSSKEKKRFLDKIEKDVFQMEERYGVDISGWCVGT